MCEVFDLNHGAWDDEKTSIADMKDKPWLLLMLLSINLFSGPWSTDARFQQTCSALFGLERHSYAERVPLFMSMLPDIACEQGLSVSEPDLASTCWDNMMSDGPVRNKSYVVNMNRFFGFTERGEEELFRKPMWFQRAFALQFVALENDWLASSQMARLTVRRRDAPDPDAPSASSTSANITSEAERALRAAAGNAYSIAAVMYADDANRWKWRIITVVGRINKEWQGRANHRLRSVSATLEWLVPQMKGEFMHTMARILGTMSDEGSLESVGFDLPCGRVACPSYGDAQLEDSWAGYLARYALTLVSRRIRRELWMLRGWPIRCALFLDEDSCDEALACFRHDAERFATLREDPAAGTKSLKSIVDRSVFNLVSVQQLLRICEQEDFKATHCP